MASVDWLAYHAPGQFSALSAEQQQAIAWLREQLPVLVSKPRCRIVRNDALPVEYSFSWQEQRLEVRFYLRAVDSKAVIFSLLKI